nr:NAD-dependent epimerase/dehydratase family protein [uncultured Sphingobacterium sp.]
MVDVNKVTNKVFITGASGFVGRNLKSYLSTGGWLVTGISMRDSNWKTQVYNAAASSIIHLAGKAHDTSSHIKAKDYFKINRDLTIELFDLFLKSDINDFFYFSSVKAVADSVTGVLMEDIKGKPVTAYGRSKFQAEQYLLTRKLPAGKRLFIIRPSMIHGPGNKGNLNLLYKVIEKGLPWPLAAFHNQRSFLSIDNLNYLIKRMILDPEIPSGVYNFADDEVVSTNDLITLIAKSMGKAPRLWNIPKKLIEVSVKLGNLFPLPLNSDRLKKLTESYVVTNQKIKSVLGVKRLPVTAREGLVKTIESFGTLEEIRL